MIDLLSSYNEYFYMSEKIDQKTFMPILIFVCKKTSIKYEFRIPRIDIHDYNHRGLFTAPYNKIPKSIEDMIIELKSIIRDIKINQII